MESLAELCWNVPFDLVGNCGYVWYLHFEEPESRFSIGSCLDPMIHVDFGIGFSIQEHHHACSVHSLHEISLLSM